MNANYYYRMSQNFGKYETDFCFQTILKNEKKMRWGNMKMMT